MLKRVVTLLLLSRCVFPLAGQHAEDASLLRRLKASEIRHDSVNGDGVMLARKIKTSKWGLVQAFGKSVTILIPFKYDSIALPDYNAVFVYVFNNKHEGVYILEGAVGKKAAKESVHCHYEELRKTDSNGCTFLAGKLNNKWGWIDWYTGKPVTTFTFQSFDALPSPDCNWHSVFYDKTGGCPGCFTGK